MKTQGEERTAGRPEEIKIQRDGNDPEVAEIGGYWFKHRRLRKHDERESVWNKLSLGATKC